MYVRSKCKDLVHASSFKSAVDYIVMSYYIMKHAHLCSPCVLHVLSIFLSISEPRAASAWLQGIVGPAEPWFHHEVKSFDSILV